MELVVLDRLAVAVRFVVLLPLVLASFVAWVLFVGRADRPSCKFLGVGSSTSGIVREVRTLAVESGSILLSRTSILEGLGRKPIHLCTEL